MPEPITVAEIKAKQATIDAEAMAYFIYEINKKLEEDFIEYNIVVVPLGTKYDMKVQKRCLPNLKKEYEKGGWKIEDKFYHSLQKGFEDEYYILHFSVQKP